MNILITGGTGFIGTRLCGRLLEQGHALTVLTRSPGRLGELFGGRIREITDLSDHGAGTACHAVINLAGEPIMARRWSESRKRDLWDSRVTLTRQLVDWMVGRESRPAVLVSGSAIGFYGDRGDTELDEASPPPTGNGFSQRLCAEWEAAAFRAEDAGIRVCAVRTGLVVGRHGGFLKPMLLPFRLGLGGPIGNGRQWMSWVHIEDHVRMLQFLLDSPRSRGVYNLTAPNPVTNMELTHALARQLHRPARLPVPASLLRLLAGEMSELLLGSQRVLPRRMLAEGFGFDFETLEPALADVLGS